MFNIRLPRLDQVLAQNSMGFATAYLPKDNDPSRTPALPPPDNTNKMCQMLPPPMPLPRINYYPIQDKMNTMAVGNPSDMKVGNNNNMAMNAMLPIGRQMKGVTVMDPFNLQALH